MGQRSGKLHIWSVAEEGGPTTSCCLDIGMCDGDLRGLRGIGDSTPSGSTDP